MGTRLSQGKEKDKADEAQRNDHYDYEDDFIDDSEFVEYYEGGDRRKAKYTGFFINKGAVEKVTKCGQTQSRSRPWKPKCITFCDGSDRRKDNN